MKILFVCLGNICRSPTAEGVMRALVASEAPGLCNLIDSAGTSDYHVGHAPDPRSIAAAQRRGYDLTALRARQVTHADFQQFDLLLAMDRSNLTELQRIAPPAAVQRVQLLLHYAPDCGYLEVPDPYGGGPQGFEQVLDLSETAVRGLIHHLQIHQPGAR